MLSKEVSSLGGKARVKLYGNFGTPAGRRLGGLRSLATHRRNKTGFQLRKEISKPMESEELAELLGILFGDGHMSDFQISVTTNSETDIEHAHFIKSLIEKLLGVSPKIRFRKDCRAVEIVVSSKSAVEFLSSKGMPIGNKIKNKFNVPEWILNKEKYERAFIRGLFDTDGSIFLDHKLINDKSYQYMGWTITTYADTLMNNLLYILKKLDLSPTNRLTQKSVYIRRKEKITNYFDKIGTNNPKHKERYIKFSGRVPKWS